MADWMDDEDVDPADEEARFASEWAQHQEADMYAPDSPQGDAAMEDAGPRSPEDEEQDTDEGQDVRIGASSRRRASGRVADSDNEQDDEPMLPQPPTRAEGLHEYGLEDEDDDSGGADGTAQGSLLDDGRLGNQHIGRAVNADVADQIRNIRSIREQRRGRSPGAPREHGAPSEVMGSEAASVADDEQSVWGESEETGQRNTVFSPRYDGFDEELLCCREDELPFNLSDFRDWHVKLPSYVNAANQDRMRPKRAMVWQIPAFYFRADAHYFRHWERRQHGVNTQGVHSRMQAHAALVALMFAGLQQGIATGKLLKRGERLGGDDAGMQDDSGGAEEPKKERSGPVFDYVYRAKCAGGEVDWPMFELCYEDLYEEQMKLDVVAVRIWLFVFDDKFSLSELVGRVMDNNRKKGMMNVANGCEPGTRDRQLVGEMTRRQQSGYGPQQIANDFERHVPSQFESITTMATYQTALGEYSGMSTTLEGRGVVDDLEAWCKAAGKTKIVKSKGVLGGESAMAPEFLFNAKRAQALQAGLVDFSGEIRVCREQLDPDSYFDAEGFFRLPTHLDDESRVEREFFWVMGHSNVRSPFDMRLPHPLCGSVAPGEDLLNLTIAVLDRKADFDKPIGDELEQDDAIYFHEQCGTQPMQQEPQEQDGEYDAAAAESRVRELNRFRSFVTDSDVMQRQSAELMRLELLPVDSMCRDVGSMNNVESFEKGGGDNEYVVRVTNECDLVCKQSNRLHEGVFIVYKNGREAMLRRRERQLLDQQDALQAAVGTLPRGGLEEQTKELERHVKVYRLRVYEHRMTCCRLKEELAKYHLRMLWTAFTSSVRRRTIPAGHVAAFNGLVEGLRHHGDSACMAFHKQGMQLTACDRTVWGHLQQWLGEIFMNDCMIMGRDRRIQDELFLQSFERYTPATWMVVVCSRRGVGKSMTATRLGKVFPPGIFVWNSQSSEKAGMNGTLPSLSHTHTRTHRPPCTKAAQPFGRQPVAEQRLRRRVRRGAAGAGVARPHGARRVLEADPLASRVRDRAHGDQEDRVADRGARDRQDRHEPRRGPPVHVQPRLQPHRRRRAVAEQAGLHPAHHLPVCARPDVQQGRLRRQGV